MNLNQLLYFSAVARTGSYSRAAEEIAVSEPVVHRAVSALEKTCGLKLFERRGKFVRLSSAGKVIFEYACRIESLAKMTEQAVVEQKESISGRLCIGASVSVVLCLLSEILPKWAVEHPLVQISIVQGPTQELQKQVLEGHVDLLIAAGTKWFDGLRKELVFSDRLGVVSATTHRLVERDLVTIDDLTKENIILTPKGTSVRDEVEEIERQFGVQFKAIVEINRFDPVKPLCRAGMGVGILPLSVASEEIANKQLCLLNVEGFPRSFPCFLLCPSHKVLTPETKSFLHAVQLWVQQRSEGRQESPVRAPLHAQASASVLTGV